MTELSLFRIYEPHELGEDDYPHVWHRGVDFEEVLEFGSDEPLDVIVTHVDLAEDAGGWGVKHLVRARAGHRCVRCGHPFTVGESGVMEGPHADSKGFAAEMGASLEQLDMALADHIELLTEDDLAKAKRTNWSDCDDRCSHDTGLDRKGRHLARWRNRLGVWTTVPMNIDADADQQASWRILTVHHLNGRKHDLRWWNLIPCCQRCHLYLQRIVVMERVYPLEHDDYFKPYAAGWYAYAYHGENLTREETMDRLDELLALERLA